MTFFKSTLSILAGLSVSATCAEASVLEYNGPKISFEQVFENPDDNALKLNYARQQAAAGDLLSAAGALEGMLYAQPNWDSARLFYAIVLFELDDRQSAMREFRLLDGRPLSSKDREQVNAYLNDTPPSTSEGATVSGKVELGVGVDSNAGNALFDSLIDVADDSDTSVFARAAVNGQIPLTSSGGVKLVGGLRGQTKRHNTFETSDYDTLGASIGLSGDISNFTVKADADFFNIYLGGDKYLTQMGPRLSISTPLSDSLKLGISAAGYQQDFEDISLSSGNAFRSGNKYIVSASVLKRVDENQNYSAAIGYENKDATERSLAYSGFSISGSGFKGFENGAYLRGNLRYRDLNYNSADRFTAERIGRNDSQLTGRASWGTSLNKVLGWFNVEPNPSLTRTYLETGLNYSNINSNISAYDYENLGADLRFIWDF